MSAIDVPEMCERYIQRRAVAHLEKGRVVILAAGSGNPGFSTDTGAAIRANEIGAKIILKATNTDGVYNKDPNKHEDARRYRRLGFDAAIALKLEVMDLTAMTYARKFRIPIRVFSLKEPGAITRALLGEDIGTFVTEGDEAVYAE